VKIGGVVGCKIAHLADVHIRGLSRHDEYREIFEAFAKDAKSNAVEHILIAGDIFHTKTVGITPEYIDLMNWLLKLLSEVAEVHIVLGNHDGNVSNVSRQDAITPIVEALNLSRVHVYKWSGVYEIAPGYNLCVFGIFDPDQWHLVKPQPGHVNIVCYHGPVWGAKTETNWDIKEGLNVSDFVEFDFGMLGDIHKMQFLAHRELEIVVAEADLVNYPGAQVLGDA